MESEIIKAKRYIFWAVIILIVILSYLLLKDLLVAIITAIVLAFITRPLYLKLNKKINNKHISSLTTVLIILLIVLGFVAIFLTAFINQLITFLSRENINQLISLLTELINSNIVQQNLSSIINEIGKALLEKIPSTISYAPIFLLNLFVIFFTTFYLLMEWETLEKKVIKIIPFKEKETIIQEIKKKTRNIIGGTFFIALIELIISAIVLGLLGVGPYLVLAFAIGILAFIPALGPAIVWIPLAFIEFLYGEFGIAIGVVILGVFLSMGIDFALRAKLLGSRTGTHPVVILFGIIGGIKLFGFIGLIIGPLILTILITLIEAIPKMEAKN